MKTRWLPLVMCSAAVIVTSSAFAAFEPLFQVVEITGDCSLQRPSEDSLSPAEQAKAYPYGTKIKTGSNSSLVISFSKGNTCRVLANGNLTVDESAINKKLKIIRLNDGEVEVELTEDFDKGGNGLDVQTATAVCSAIGCKFRVASKSEEDLRVIIIRVIDGLIRVHGDNFAAQELNKDDWLSLLSPSDRSFLRLKTLKGEFDVTIKDQDLQDKVIPTKEGTVLKIWQRPVPGTEKHVVTIVHTAPDGQLIQTYTVTFNEGQTAGFGDDLAAKGDDGDSAVDVKGDDEGEKDKVASNDRDNPEPWETHRYDKFDSIDDDPDPAKDPVPATHTYTPAANVPPPAPLPPTPTKVGRR